MDNTERAKRLYLVIRSIIPRTKWFFNSTLPIKRMRWGLWLKEKWYGEKEYHKIVRDRMEYIAACYAFGSKMYDKD